MTFRRVDSSLSVLLFNMIIVFVSAGEQEIRATPGENVTLPCRAENKHITVLEWGRPDPEEFKIVALYLDQFDYHHQHPAYRNRVDLLDREMKHGDVSLILKDVRINDTGTYECRVVQRENKRRKRSYLDNDPVCIINLSVSVSGNQEKQKGNELKEDKAANTGLTVGLSVGILLGLAVIGGAVGFLLYRKLRQSSQKQNQPPTAAAVLQPMNAENPPEPLMNTRTFISIRGEPSAL